MGVLLAMRLLHELLEAAEIDLLALDAQPVAGRPRLEQVGAEQLAQLRDEVLQRRRGRPRRPLAPEAVDQAVGRHHPSGLEQQEREDRAQLLAPDGYRLAVGEHLDGAEQPELEH